MPTKLCPYPGCSGIIPAKWHCPKHMAAYPRQHRLSCGRVCAYRGSARDQEAEYPCSRKRRIKKAEDGAQRLKSERIRIIKSPDTLENQVVSGLSVLGTP